MYIIITSKKKCLDSNQYVIMTKPAKNQDYFADCCKRTGN